LIRGVTAVGGTIGAISTERWARAGHLPTTIPALLANIALHSFPAAKTTLCRVANFINTKVPHRRLSRIVSDFVSTVAWRTSYYEIIGIAPNIKKSGAWRRSLALMKQRTVKTNAKEKRM
jgi:hypothetical protein